MEPHAAWCMHCTHILWRIIRHPRNKRNLASLALAAFRIILNIEHGISPSLTFFAALVLALGVEQLLSEFAVIWVTAGLLNYNFFPVVADLVDNPFGGFAEFELVEGLDAFRCY